MSTPNEPTLQPLSLQPLNDDDTGDALDAGVSDVDAVSTELSVRVGRVRMTLAQLLATRAHQVIKLDQLIDAPVDLIAGQTVIARGQLMALDDHFAVRITEPPRHKAL